VQKQEVSGTDIPGTISLVLGMIALAALGMGWFTHGVTYYAAVVVALIGFGLGFLGRGNLRIADCSLNFLALLPAVVVTALLLAGMPVTKREPVVAKAPIVESPKTETHVEDPTPAPEEPKWVDASKGLPVRVGDVMVRIGDVRMGVSKSVDMNKALEMLDPDKILRPDVNAVTETPALLVDVQVGNPSDRIKLEFKPWSKGRGGDQVRLTDNFKNGYKQRIASTSLLSLGGTSSTTPESIMPNTTVPDTLTFEVPVAKMEYLRLELPAENFGATGKLYFQIPRKMVQGMR
jgi:hypothetical protein